MKSKFTILIIITLLIALILTYYNFSYNNNGNQLIEEISNSEIKQIEKDLFEKQEIEIQNWPKLDQNITSKEGNFE